MDASKGFGKYFLAFSMIGCCAGHRCCAQIDPAYRELLELGYDQPLVGQGPPGGYAYLYYHHPELLHTNIALRLALAPVYLDGEVGFKRLLSPDTDFGVGLNGGGYSDDYYEIRQGKYLKAESFNGDGGGASASIYQFLNPGMRIPLNLIGRGGVHYPALHSHALAASRE